MNLSNFFSMKENVKFIIFFIKSNLSNKMEYRTPFLAVFHLHFLLRCQKCSKSFLNHHIAYYNGMNGWTNTAKISIKKKNCLQASGQILIYKDRKKAQKGFSARPAYPEGRIRTASGPSGAGPLKALGFGVVRAAQV